MIYTIFIAVMLIPFGCSMHGMVVKNVTTNENIRKKWNAKKDRKSGTTSVTTW